MEAKLREDFLFGSKRRAVVQRLGRNCAVIVIAERKVSVVKILRIVDDISNLFLLLRCS
jgi:hypothetical protein